MLQQNPAATIHDDNKADPTQDVVLTFHSEDNTGNPARTEADKISKTFTLMVRVNILLILSASILAGLPVLSSEWKVMTSSRAGSVVLSSYMVNAGAALQTSARYAR